MLIFTTGDAVLSGNVAVTVVVPKSQSNWLFTVFLGAIYNMGQSFAWQTGGESTPDEAANIFQEVFNNGVTPVLFDVGDIKWSGSSIAPFAAWLLCDGAIYAQSVYPDLFSAIGSTFNTGGEGTGNFRVPDLRGRVAAVVNSGTGRLPGRADTLGGVGGESDHTPTVSETPSHSHTDLGHTHVEGSTIPSAALPPAPPVLVPTAVGSISITGSGNANLTSTGGDRGHNNVQTTVVLFTYILPFISRFRR